MSPQPIFGTDARNAVEFNPIYPAWYLYIVGAAQHFGGHDEALATTERVLAANPRLAFARALKIAVLTALGRREEAKVEGVNLLRDHPEFSTERFASTQPFRDTARSEQYINALRDAGIP